MPHAGSWEAARIWEQAHAFNAPIRPVQTDQADGDLPANASFVEIRPAHLVLSAIKRAEDEDALVLRFYNITNANAAGEVILHFPIRAAYRANLNEEKAQPLDVNDGRRIRVPVRGKEIVTLLLYR